MRDEPNKIGNRTEGVRDRKKTIIGVALLAAGGFAVGTLAGFVISSRWGLFGYRETFWGSWQEAAGGVELAAVVAAALSFALRLS